MPSPTLGAGCERTCEKPSCDYEAKKTYRGEHGNSLRLCKRHYYNLVTSGKSTGADALGIGTDRPPSYDFDPHNPEPVKIPTDFGRVDPEDIPKQPSIWSDALEEAIKNRPDS